MMINGKSYSWESLAVAIGGETLTGFTDVEFAHVEATRPMLISITLPARLRGIPVEFRHRYVGDPELPA